MSEPERAPHLVEWRYPDDKCRKIACQSQAMLLLVTDEGVCGPYCQPCGDVVLAEWRAEFDASREI